MPDAAPPRIPAESVRRIDWLAVAPWVLLFRAPAAALGTPMVIATAALAVAGAPDFSAPWSLPGPESAPSGWQGVRGIAVSAVEQARRGAVPWALLWQGGVWSFCGLLVSRRAAAALTRTPLNAGIRADLAFGARGVRSLGGALVLAAVALGAVAVLLWVVGLAARWLPDAVAPVLHSLAVVVAAPLAAAILLAAVAWLLLITAIAVDRSDAFDALSRVTAYVTQAILRLAGYLTVAIAVGCFAGLLIAALTATAEQVAIALLGDGPLRLPAFTRLWLRSGFGFLPAYLFTATTAIYLLLRRDVDGHPLDEASGPDGQGVGA